MKKQVFAQKMNNAGYLRKIVGILFTALILISMAQVCLAEPNVAQSWSENESGKAVAYVRVLPDVQAVTAVIGTSETGEVTAARLQDLQDSHMMTYILVDNSASINQADKDKIRQIIYTMVENRIPGEWFKFATFDEEIHVVNEFSEDYGAVLASADTIDYQNRQTYVMKAVYQIFGELQSDDGSHSYKRLLIFSDGGEGSTGGDYTLQEALNSLEKNPFPIYTMGCRWNNNQEVLDNFAALARQSGGAYFTLDDVTPENLIEIQNAMAQDYTAYRFDVPVPAELQDGSVRSLELNIGTSQGNVTVSGSVKMPQNSKPVELPVITEIPEVLTPPPTLAPTHTPAPTVTPTQTPTPLPAVTSPPEPEKSFFQKYWLGILIVLLLIIAAVILIVSMIRSKKKRRDEEIRREIDTFIEHKRDSGGSGDETELYPAYDDRTRTTGYDGREEDLEATEVMFEATSGYSAAGRPGAIHIRLEDINRPGVVYSTAFNGESLVVGRSSRSGLTLRDDPAVSGRHFEFTASGRRVYVEDAGSRNGTWLNGNRLHARQEVHGGDVIRAGDTELRVDISS